MADAGDVADAFGARVEIREPDADALGYFAVVRRSDADHDAFVNAVLAGAGDGAHLLLQHPGGLVVVGTSFERAQSLRSHPSVRLVGGVDVDVEQLNAMLGGATSH